jgi:hypothetical protein
VRTDAKRRDFNLRHGLGEAPVGASNDLLGHAVAVVPGRVHTVELRLLRRKHKETARRPLAVISGQILKY